MDVDGARYAGLVGTTLLVPTPDAPEVPGTWTLVERDVLSMAMEEDALGLLTPAFTTIAALDRWRPEGGCHVERPAAWLFRIATADPEGRVVIDAGSPSSVLLAPGEVAELAEGRSPADLGGAGASPMLVATPIEPLAEPVGSAVRAALDAEPAVSSARLFLVDQTGTGPQTMVLVELDPDLPPDEIEAVMTRVVAAISTATDQAGGLTFAVVTADWRDTYETGGLEVLRPR